MGISFSSCDSLQIQLFSNLSNRFQCGLACSGWEFSLFIVVGSRLVFGGLFR